jgi:hypothetical protein
MNYPQKKPANTAWEQAEEYGFDMSLLECNIRLSVTERLKRHDAALRAAKSLQKAVKQQHGKFA